MAVRPVRAKAKTRQSATRVLLGFDETARLENRQARNGRARALIEYATDGEKPFASRNDNCRPSDSRGKHPPRVCQYIPELVYIGMRLRQPSTLQLADSTVDLLDCVRDVLPAVDRLELTKIFFRGPPTMEIPSLIPARRCRQSVYARPNDTEMSAWNRLGTIYTYESHDYIESIFVDAPSLLRCARIWELKRVGPNRQDITPHFTARLRRYSGSGFWAFYYSAIPKNWELIFTSPRYTTCYAWELRGFGAASAKGLP